MANLTDDDLESKCTELANAVNRGNLAKVQAIVNSVEDPEKRKDLLNRRDFLYSAAFGGHVSVIAWLLAEDGGRAAGFDGVLKTTGGGRTALQCAATRGHLEACKALMDGCREENGEKYEMLYSVGDHGVTVLHAAARQGRESIVNWLFSLPTPPPPPSLSPEEVKKRRLTSSSTSGSTPLHFAAMKGDVASCKAIIRGCKDDEERREMLNAVDSHGRNILAFASMFGRTPIISWLLSEEEDGGRRAGLENIFPEESTALSPLQSAVLCGHLDACKAIVAGCRVENGERSRMLNSIQGEEDGSNVLIVAAEHNHVPIIKWLLSEEEGGGRSGGFAGVLGKKSSDGSTALLEAAQRGPEAFFAVVEGCRVENGEREEMLNSVSTSHLLTVLHLAAICSHTSIVRYLLSETEGRQAGFNKVLYKSLREESTVLHFAAKNGSSELVQAVVDGCRAGDERHEMMNATNKDGMTILHLTVQYCGRSSSEVLSWILSDEGGRKAGFESSSVTAANKNGLTALHILVAKGNKETMEAFLSRCTPNERVIFFLGADLHGWTPFHYAARSRNTATIAAMLQFEESELNVDCLDSSGMSALHRAVSGGHDEAARKAWKVDFGEVTYRYNTDGDSAEQVVAALLGLEIREEGREKEEKEEEGGESKDDNSNNKKQLRCSCVDVNLGCARRG